MRYSIQATSFTNQAHQMLTQDQRVLAKFMYNDEFDVTQMEVLQKWEEPFRELMDQIYYSGFSDQLLEEDPENYQREYWYFLSIYG